MALRITCEDTETGDTESRTIENDYCLITDGDLYLDGIQRHANGTVVLTIKKQGR